MKHSITTNELYLIVESVRFHLEDISNFPEENGEEVVKEYEYLLEKLEKEVV